MHEGQFLTRGHLRSLFRHPVPEADSAVINNMMIAGKIYSLGLSHANTGPHYILCKGADGYCKLRIISEGRLRSVMYITRALFAVAPQC